MQPHFAVEKNFRPKCSCMYKIQSYTGFQDCWTGREKWLATVFYFVLPQAIDVLTAVSNYCNSKFM